MAHIATITIEGLSPYSASRAHESPKKDRETADAYETRTWPMKAHIESGNIVIPAMALKQSIDRAAKMIGEQIPGKGKATYTKFFSSGVLVLNNIPIAPESAIESDRIHANADGVRGSGKRVWRIFPKVQNWKATFEVTVLANEITKDVFERHIRQAGNFVGVGRFRPENGGFYGRFRVTELKWAEYG